MLKSRLIYLGILLSSFIFSQALYESVSFMTFVIVLVLPVISILIAAVIYPLLNVKLITNSSTVNRLDEFVLRIVLTGICPLISPDVKITCFVPGEEGRGVEKTIFAVSPTFAFKSYFDYRAHLVNRGIYSIKVVSVEYYDFLKLIRIKKKFKREISINIVPRKIKLDIPVASEQYNQENTYTIGEKISISTGDMVGVRDYVLGDNLKFVHWKLSSKSEELITKTFAEDICDRAYIIVDMASYYDDVYLNRSMTDCVAEVALSSIEEYSKTAIRFGVILSEGKSAYKRFSVVNPSDRLSAELAVAESPMISNTNIVEFLNSVDFNLLSGAEVLIITSFRSADVLKDVKKIFVDKKVKFKVINIVENDRQDNADIISYTRDYLENHVRGIR